MTRRTIELYNLDKYDAYLPTPKIDRIEGSADEIILSADGYEESASSGHAGSLTINASGGVWMDSGPRCTCEVSTLRTITLPDPHNSNHAVDQHEECCFLSFDKTKFRSGQIDMTVQSGTIWTTKRLIVIHNNTSVTTQVGESITVPNNSTHDVSVDTVIVGDNVKLYVSGVPDGTIVSCICKYTLV